MRTLQHALSSLLTPFFGPRTDVRDVASWYELLFWLVVIGLLVFLVDR